MEVPQSQLGLIFDGVFLIRAEMGPLPNDTRIRRRYLTSIEVLNGSSSSVALDVVVVPDAECMALEVNQRYGLRGPVLPGTNLGQTIFYPTARSAMIVMRCDESMSEPVPRINVISRGRVIQCREQRSHSRWWVNVLHTIYNEESGRYVNFEVDHYLSRSVMRQAQRANFQEGNVIAIYGFLDNFIPRGDRWGVTVLEAEPVVRGPFEDFWLLI